ncbi:hypothetical protein MNV49_001504 [Pseudohyphozyma bogoriensis]|nr:hypothetical protein MNV49_001504 [Pseudohyphozyma bogoriensis]
MATLERAPSAQLDDISETTSTVVDHSAAPPSGPVPTPFPRTTSASRSPSASRVGNILGKVRRAISSSRERSSEGSSRERGGERRPSVGHGIAEEEEEERGRGRSGVQHQIPTHDLRATQTNTTVRSLSRGRTPGASVLSTGRGGAGNMKAVKEDGAGGVAEDEDPELVERVREAQKSRSRSRGREEVHASGRGGRGNIRSQERETEEEKKKRVITESRERKLEDEMRKKDAAAPKFVASGRGGAGNIKFSAGGKA